MPISTRTSSLDIPRSVSNDDDGTEESPEPSPLALPQHFTQSISRRPLWTPQLTGNQSLSVDFEEEDEDESIPTIPDVPSPYSPPPASLFSGEVWAERTVGKGGLPREVRTSPPTSSSTNEDDSLEEDDDISIDQSLEQRLSHVLQATPGLSSASRLTPTTSADTENRRRKSALLPAVLHLKKDLENSHQSVFLLQQENKALAAECDRFQKQLEEWQETAKTEKEALEQEKMNMRQQVQSLTTANEKLTRDRRDLQSRVDSLEKLEKEIKDAVFAKEKLQREMESIKKEQEQASGAVAVVEDGKKALESELLATRAKRDTLESERKGLLEKIETLESDIVGMRSKLKSQAMEASRKLQATKKGLEEVGQNLQKENSSFKLEIDRLKAMLKESEKKNGKDSEVTISRVSELQTEVTQLRTSLHKANTKATEMRAQKTALRKELMERNRPQREIACQTDSTPVSEVREMAMQTDPLEGREIGIQTNTLASEHVVAPWVDGTGRVKTGSSITLRLGRIRDAAERAAFVQEYRHELEKLAKKHDTELVKLEKKHEENLQEVLKHAKEEVHTRIRSYKQRLNKECESKVARLEQRHEAELSRIRQEFDASKIATEEKMKAVVIEASSSSDRLRREVSTRKQLEETVRELERRVTTEERKVCSFETKQQEWEARTREILEQIQRECNSVFDKSKMMSGMNVAGLIMRKNSETMPLSSADRIHSKISFDLEDIHCEVPAPSAAMDSSMISHSSQIDRALDETEALVLSLVGNDFRM